MNHVANELIAVVYRPPAMTADQYKKSWAAGPPVAPPPGLIFHASAGEGDEFFTITVWESREAYDAFAPIFKQAMKQLEFNVGEPLVLPVHQVLPRR
jgi:heme-degrading monooxygenase HmoA